jgi:hypothetical protein
MARFQALQMDSILYVLRHPELEQTLNDSINIPNQKKKKVTHPPLKSE